MSSDNNASADDGASEPPARTSPAAPLHTCSSNRVSRPYEEERRILLNSVAESMAKVVGKMGALNEQLKSTADSCREVEEVASVWGEALGDGGGDDNGDNDDTTCISEA